MKGKDFDARIHIGFLTDAVSRDVRKAVARGMVSTNEDPCAMKHGWLLGYLKRQKDPVYQKDMEKVFHFPKSTLADMIQTLEKAGFIEKVPVDGDGRKKQIIVTEKGLRFNKKAESQIMEVEDFTTHNITDEEIEITIRVLEKMRENAAAYKSEIKTEQKED